MVLRILERTVTENASRSNPGENQRGARDRVKDGVVASAGEERDPVLDLLALASAGGLGPASW